MSIIVKKNRTFTPAPEGVFHAVCVDVTPIKPVETAWGTKEKLSLVWELSEKMEDGRPFLAFKRYSPSLDDKSNLRKDLKIWRGRDFTADELRGFDLENVIGAACQLVITHAEKDGEVYANITAIMKAGQTKLEPSGKYVRFKDRPDYKPEPQQAKSQQSSEPDMAPDDIPF